MKNLKSKKWISITIAIVVLVVIGVGCFLIFKPAKSDEPKITNKPSTNKKITISFKTDSNDTIDDMIIDSGSTIKLPTPTKKGYLFDGWYLDDEKVDENTIFKKDTKLNAKWIDDDKAFTVKFDSKGGSKVSNLVVKCGNNLNMPKNPTRNGYRFVTWEDKNGMPIYNDAKLSCEDVTLYAVWESQSTIKEDYTCAEGGNLDGTKCIKEGTVHEKCPDGTNEFEGKCITISASARKDGARSCEKLDIHVNSYSGKEDGELVFAGTYFCYYHKLSYNTESECTGKSGQYGNFVWRSSNSTCYVTMKNATMNCNNLDGYTYIAKPSTVKPGANINGGCYPINEKQKYLDNGYALTNDKCIKTYDAIKVKYD